MTKTAVVSALSIALAACGWKGADSPTIPATANANALFELGELTVLEGTQAMLKTHADGTTELRSRSVTMEPEPGQPASSDSLPLGRDRARDA